MNIVEVRLRIVEAITQHKIFQGAEEVVATAQILEQYIAKESGSGFNTSAPADEVPETAPAGAVEEPGKPAPAQEGSPDESRTSGPRHKK